MRYTLYLFAVLVVLSFEQEKGTCSRIPLVASALKSNSIDWVACIAKSVRCKRAQQWNPADHSNVPRKRFEGCIRHHRQGRQPVKQESRRGVTIHDLRRTREQHVNAHLESVGTNNGKLWHRTRDLDTTRKRSERTYANCDKARTRKS